MSDFDSASSEETCKVARQIWTEMFAAPRKGATDRLDAGVPRKRKENTEASFLRKRRVEAGGAQHIVSAKDVIAETEAIATEEMTEKMQSELLFQEHKKFRNRLLAYLDHALLENEVTPDMAQMARAYLEHRATLDVSRQRAEKRKFALMSPDLPKLDSQPIYLEDMAWLNLTCLRGRTVVGDEIDAQIFVVQRVAQPSLTTQWAVGLRGGHMVDLEFLRSNGKAGVCISHDPAIAIARKVYMCALFTREHQVLATMVRQASRLPHSKWKLLSSWDEFFTHRKSQGWQCIALTTARAMNICGGRDIFDKIKFQDTFLSKLVVASRNLCAKQPRQHG